MWKAVNRWPLAWVALLGLLASTSIPARGGVIVDPTNSFAVGIDTLGNLFDPDAQVGFLRIADDYDPILPGAPREAWGVSAGGTGGEVDPQGFSGVVNILPTGPPVFGPHSAVIGTALMLGASPILLIDQAYGFVADNVLKVTTTITNVSGSAQPVLASRQVDWDMIAGHSFTNLTFVPTLTPPIVAASFNGFEDADPSVPFQYPVGPGGGIAGPDDLGAGFQLDLGSIADGGSTTFAIYQGISRPGQSRADLLDELNGLGSTFTITGTSVDGPTTDSGSLSAALGYGPVLAESTTASPEPATWISGLFGLAIVWAAARSRRSRSG